MKPNFRARVMKYAHQLLKSTGNQWRICLIKAWELYRLSLRMKKGIVKFAYQKIDGSIRHACGTLSNIPTSLVRKGKPSYKTFSYFDTDKLEYRCFKIENLLTIY